MLTDLAKVISLHHCARQPSPGMPQQMGAQNMKAIQPHSRRHIDRLYPAHMLFDVCRPAPRNAAADGTP